MSTSLPHVRTMRRSRRFTVVAAALAVGLGACGSSDDAGTDSTVPTPQVIEVASGSGADRTAAAGEATTDAMTPSFDSRIAYIEYRYEGELPVLDGPAPSWFFAAGQEPSAERVQALAAALGVTGEVQSLPADMGGGWSVGPTDGSAPAVMVSRSSLLDWWYSPGPLESASVGCASAGVDPTVDPADSAPDAPVPSTVDPCPEPEPPTGVPTSSEAQADATELFGSLGYDMSQYELEVYADEWGASVTAWRLLEGHRSPISMNVGFGGDAAVTWVSGILAEPQRGADYPRIGAAAGFERLQEQGTGWGVFGDVAARSAEPATGAAEPATAPATDPVIDPDAVGDVDKPLPCPEPQSAADAASTDASTSDASTSDSDAGSASPIDPATETLVPQIPLDCVVEETAPEPLLVTLNGVREDLTMVWAADETVWLLPAYTFTSADGGLYTVNAVVDEYLVQVEPEPGVEPAVDPVTDTAAVPVAPEPGTDQTSPAITADEAAAAWVGLPLAEVEQLAKEIGLTVRVVSEDGQDLAVTDDLRTDRVNLAVEAGIVTEVRSIG
ncbi:MAG: hypothetical protein AB7Q42_20445 [Acidimicrobiia bacterium]